MRTVSILLVFTMWRPVPGAERKASPDSEVRPVLWKAPADIRRRDLIYGAGGREHAPRPPFRFEKEDLDGTSPKYNVIDAAGVKWKVKLGLEARPETAASRLVWAAGYFTAEDYYLPDLQVSGVPAKLHRGGQFVDGDGTMHGARLKRRPGGAEKTGTWSWKCNPFLGSREFNGLRTLMALINNWDVKDVNNAVFRLNGDLVYEVSDLGASFGAPGNAYPTRLSKGNLGQYRQASFFCGVGSTEVNFCAPARPSLFRLVDLPQFVRRMRLRWIGDDIPRADAHWLGIQLSRLSSRQIRDAFRSAGYDPETAEAFASVVEHRIGELSEL